MGQSGVTAISLLLEISSLEVDRKKTARLWPPVVTSGHGGLASTYPRAKAMHQARMRIPASTGIQCHPLERQATELAIECEWRRVGLTRERYLLKVKSGRQQ